MNLSGLTHEEADQLRRRARRRLIGAIFLVLVALGLLWQSFHQTPKTFQSQLVQADASGDLEGAMALDASAVSSDASGASLAPSDIVAAGKEETQADIQRIDPQVAQTRPIETIKSNDKLHVVQPTKPSTPALAKKLVSSAKLLTVNPKIVLSAKQSKQSASTTTSHHIMIQLAALANPKMVEALKAKLAHMGIRASFIKAKTSKGEIVRVRLGPFLNLDDAHRMIDKLAQHGLSGTVLP